MNFCLHQLPLVSRRFPQHLRAVNVSTRFCRRASTNHDHKFTLPQRRWQDEDIRNASAQGKCMKMRRENHVMVKTAMTIASKVRPHDNMIVTCSYTRYYSYWCWRQNSGSRALSSLLSRRHQSNLTQKAGITADAQRRDNNTVHLEGLFHIASWARLQADGGRWWQMVADGGLNDKL